jgi:bifunctional NMN adenylyltransferase/nudix hydrolase
MENYKSKLGKDLSLLQNYGKRAAGKPRSALSSSKSYDLLVFIGRFQPLHKGHQVVIDRALELAKNVLVIIGSAGKARSVRNPFIYEERVSMFNSVYGDKVVCAPMCDATYNDTEWVLNVQKIVNKHALEVVNEGGFHNHGLADIKIGLIGSQKDHSGYYLKLFPQWDSEPVDFLSPIHATYIREMWLKDTPRWELDAVVHDEVSKFLVAFSLTSEFDRLLKEYDYLQEYKKQWGEGPHLTADALVQVGGNILLIKRGKEYGHGLYALPGGFLKKNERFFEGAIRELKEETRLKVPVPVLKGSRVTSDMFDEPHRSERGIIVTCCFHFKLENELDLPEVRGSDDAEWAGFEDFSTLEEKDFFEDHYHIIRKMLGL